MNGDGGCWGLDVNRQGRMVDRTLYYPASEEKGAREKGGVHMMLPGSAGEG